MQINNTPRQIRLKMSRKLEFGLRRRLILGLVTASFLFICAWARILPQSLDLVEGDIAVETIRAPRSGIFVDEDEMQRLRAEAADSVSEVFIADLNATDDALDALDDIYDAFFGTRSDTRLPTLEEKVQHLQIVLDIQLSKDTLRLAMSTSTSDAALLRLKESCISIVQQLMSKEIRSNTDDLEMIRGTTPKAAQNLGLTDLYSSFVADISRSVLKANQILDTQETARLRDARMSSIKEIKHYLQPGDIIVLAREEIRARHIAAFEAVGLMQAQINYRQALALFFAFLLMVFGLGAFSRRYARKIYLQFDALVVICAYLVMTAFVCRILEPTSWFEAASMSMAVLSATIIALLFDPLLALAVCVCLAMMVPIIAAGSDARLALITFVSSAAAVFVISRRGSRSSVIGLSALVMAVVCCLISIVSREVFGLTINPREAIIAMVGGFMAPMMAFGATVVLERILGITTDFRLMELGNPMEPILQQLMTKAPGSYQSSVMVGNLAEPAAELIGANALLVRIAALYHDIGKIRRPLYFVENQFSGQTPHARLSPHLSARIIIAHVKDGLELAEEHNLPPVIRAFISEHQGTTLVRYFYQKALEAAREAEGEDAEIDEANYRYPGPKPQSRETALFMLADTIEAAARTLEHPGPEELEELVERLVNDRQRDGQLDDSPLTFRDLKIIKESFINTLVGIFHQRIKYPDAPQVRKSDEGLKAVEPDGRERSLTPREELDHEIDLTIDSPGEGI